MTNWANWAANCKGTQNFDSKIVFLFYLQNDLFKKCVIFVYLLNITCERNDEIIHFINFI